MNISSYMYDAEERAKMRFLPPPLQVIKTEQRQFEKWVLTAEGTEVVERGSHEARVYDAVDPKEGTSQAELMVCVCVCVVEILCSSEIVIRLSTFVVSDSLLCT